MNNIHRLPPTRRSVPREERVPKKLSFTAALIILFLSGLFLFFSAGAVGGMATEILRLLLK